MDVVDDIKAVEILVNMNADLDVQNDYSGETALMKAVKIKSKEVIQKLINSNADLTLKDKNNLSILEIANLSYTPDQEIVDMLTACRCNLTLIDL